MKLTKEQEDFLGICWKMKVRNIVPQAAKLGIPEAEVRKYLAKKGLSIDGGGFVFQGKGKDLSAEEFRAVMLAANRRYQAAVTEYVTLADDEERKIAAAKMVDLRDEIVWLIGGLLDPSSEEYGIMARREARELLSKPKGRRERRSTQGGSPAPLSHRNTANRHR